MLRVYSAIAEYHDLRLIALAGLICFLACYTAFSIMSRLYAQRSRYPWVIAAAVVTGCGAWATHAIGLLAFTPGVPVAYNVGLTVFAGLIAVLGCGIGYYVARGTEQMALGGAIIGFSIAAMHYIGMTAITLQAQVHRDILYDEAAVVIGASFGAAALSRSKLTPDFRGRIVSAALLTCAICGTHFVGMAGMVLMPDPRIAIPQDTLAIVWFAIALTAVVLLILGLGIVGALADQHIQEIEGHKRELEAALALADAASKSKTKFLATMSHELRSPLNVIIGFSELLTKGARGPREEQQRDYVGRILSSGVQLLHLVNDILDISRYDSGQLFLNEDITDPREAVVSCLHDAALEAEKAGVRLTSSVQERLPQLRADSKRIRQVLSNLLSNAIRFTPQGGDVKISMFLKDGALMLSVADTGIGMGAHEIPKALERFGQIDSELSRRYGGAGLGLPLSQHLMELHGGSLHIESEPGAGTVVTASLPESRLIKERVPAHAESMALQAVL
jgi:signal transduction histidine kinase